jgi:hypothetical protein
MSVSSTEFVESGAGQYTATFDLDPGKGKDIEVRIAANQVGNFDVRGRAIYYFGNDKIHAEDQPLNLPITVADSKQHPASMLESYPIPGFELVSLISVLITVFALKRNKKR